MKKNIKKKILNINRQANWWADCWICFIDGEDFFSNKRQVRGRKLCMNNAVKDIVINQGKIITNIKGTAPNSYCVEIDIPPFIKWDIVKMCQSSGIDYSSLIAGNIPKRMKNSIKNIDYGIFSIRYKLKLSCTCPDHMKGGYICKHIYASFYKAGQKIQKEPELFFIIFQIKIERLQQILINSRPLLIKKKTKCNL
ncbi:Zinc finger, SWIM-type domain protein [Candidatus Magnetomorum sp. HK-1]|nr:Zinc finger, SWIM-type domain protein [Candidatus Magnetomorum sp. HK-1]